MRRLLPPVLVLAGFLELGGCVDREGAAPLAEFPAGTGNGAVMIGADDPDDPRAAIGRVVAARFTESGQHVVVLDYAPPYVKIFRRDGVLEAALLERGGGPLEMRDPSALAVSGDSLILVADGSRKVAVFGLDGVLRGEGRTSFPVLAAAAGCNGDWFAYGPRFDSGPRPTWAHRIRVGPGGVEVQEMEFRDAVGDGVIGNGLAYGIARDGGGARVWHALVSEPAVVGWRCDGRQVEAWPVQPLGGRGTAQERNGAVQMSIGPGHRSLGGMAAVGDAVVLAAQVVPRPGEPATTEFTRVSRDGERTVAVTGRFTLRDAHPVHGVLVSTPDPAPRLFTIAADDLRVLFEPGS